MDLFNEVKRLLLKYSIKPRKSAGQSFCVDICLLERMLTYSTINEKDTVLEIGAGFGFLTQLLSEVAKEVIAIELDPKLVKALKELLQGKKNVRIIEGDFLKVYLPKFNKVVANPPYSISTHLVKNLFTKKIENAVLTLQKEFVQKLTAKKGSRNYGGLSVITHYNAAVKTLEDVPRHSFYPHPDVDSNVVLIKPRKPFFNVGDESLFLKIVPNLFSQRNKKMRNALEVFIRNEYNVKKTVAKILVEDFPYLESKVYDLKPKEFGEISRKVHSIFGSVKD
jgi:16S rRNA (adenine1518-N6/adenine1519-N6)-dimethyltransferase